MALSIFMYHDIREENKSYFPERYALRSFITPNEFEKQIRFIKSNYTVLCSSEIYATDLSKDDYALITFDDGLTDHYVNGYQILRDYNLNGTFFIPVEAIRDRIMFHSHKIQFILAATSENNIVGEICQGFLEAREEFGLPDITFQEIWKKYKAPLVKDSWWSDEMIFVTRFFREFGSYKFRDHLLRLLFRKFVDSDERHFVSDFYLTLDEIRDMINNGMQIGGHGFHSVNARNETEKIQISEIEKTHQYLRDVVFNGDEFDFYYSYPNGGYTNYSTACLSRLNCKAAFTTIKKKFLGNDMLEIPRFDAPIDLKACDS